MRYPIPDNERERLDELQKFRDIEWGYSEALNRLCALASRQLGTPINLVSLVDATEQRFPGKHGLDAASTSRDVAFCAHAIMNSEPLVIENAAKDARFSKNPLVTGLPGIGAYAGIPLESASGFRLGTFCAIDTKPRSFSEKELEFLSDLSHIAISLMESHRTKLMLADQLGEANAMQAKLQDSETRYDLCVRGSAVGLWDWDIASDRIFWSDRFKEIAGIRDKRFTPTLSYFQERLHRDDHDRIMEHLERHLKTGEPFDVEYRLHSEAGGEVWIHARGQAIWDQAGNPTRMAGSVDDITERKSAALQIERYARELQRSNRELDQFAYAASHDLKAPLRVIDNASSWLEEDLADRLSQKERKAIELLRNRVQRMEKLLDDLLDYSRVGRISDSRTKEFVRADRLIDDILALLSPRSSMTIEVAPEFGEIEIARMPLQQVLYNLINNAIKHHDRDEGTIRLEVERRPETYQFTVRDDGPGIGPDDQLKVFDMFRTLKPRDQVEGSGMGLALVKKTVEHFGGTITLQSDGRGAAFSFSWPKERAEDRKHENAA